jgi:hypothetical protein
MLPLQSVLLGGGNMSLAILAANVAAAMTGQRIYRSEACTRRFF